MAELKAGNPASRMRIYISEGDRWQGKALYDVLLRTMRSMGMAGATIFRGMAGFGAHSRVHNAGIEVLAMELPVVIEVVDTSEKINAAINAVSPMVREGLITVEDVNIIKYTHRFLHPLPVDRLVSDVMTTEVISLQSDMTVGDAWNIMLNKVVKAAPVLDESGSVVGILTDEDLLERAGIQQRLSIAIRMHPAEISKDLHSLASSQLKVKEVMTSPVVTVRVNDTLGEATERLVKLGLKRLPVVDQGGKLAGIISRLDVLKQVADSRIATYVNQLPTGIVSVVRDIMDAKLPIVNQNEELAGIIDKFAQFGSHRLIVVDDNGIAIGLISDSDVVARVHPARQRGILDALKRLGKPPAGSETAYDLMSPNPLTCSPDLPVVTAVALMIKDSRKWLVVIDEQGKPMGLVDRQAMLVNLAS